MGWLAARLAASTVACRQMEIDPAHAAELVRYVRPEVGSNPLSNSVADQEEVARLALEEAMSPLGVAEAAAEKLKSIPPMTRLVVEDYLERPWQHGRLGSEEKRYGGSSKWNEQYLDWLGFFGSPRDDSEVPHAVKRDALREAVEQQGIVCKKSTSRAALIEQARAVPGLLSGLIARLVPESRDLRPEWAASVKEWSVRLQHVKPVGAALIKLLGVSAMKWAKPENIGKIALMQVV